MRKLINEVTKLFEGNESNLLRDTITILSDINLYYDMQDDFENISSNNNVIQDIKKLAGKLHVDIQTLRLYYTDWIIDNQLDDLDDGDPQNYKDKFIADNQELFDEWLYQQLIKDFSLGIGYAELQKFNVDIDKISKAMKILTKSYGLDGIKQIPPESLEELVKSIIQDM